MGWIDSLNGRLGFVQFRGRPEGQGRTERGTKRLEQLGVIAADDKKPLEQKDIIRRSQLELYDSYYEGRAYDHLPAWEDCVKSKTYVPIRQRRPRINFNLVRLLATRVAGKTVGKQNFPSFKNPLDPDYEQYIRSLMRVTNFRFHMVEPTRRLYAAGSVFVRFFLRGGQIHYEHYLSKYVHPIFGDDGEPEAVRIQYVFEDHNDLDKDARPRLKWFRLDLGKFVDISYDTPLYGDDKKPEFQEVARADHNLGIVQGEWLRTSFDKHSPDGESLFCDVLGFVDSLSYSLSQTDMAVEYNQDPQLWFKGMTEDEITDVVRSATKSWNLGKEGESGFLETTLTGVQRAEEVRDKMRLHIGDLTRIVMMDPEKMVTSAQSGKALEILHGPFVELIHDIQPTIERSFVKLITKVGLVVLTVNNMGGPVPIMIPAGFRPKSLDLQAKWPNVFPVTIEDMQKKVGVVLQLTNGSIFSREWGLEYLAEDFGVENLELEKQRVATQPIINPFGAF